MIKTLTQPYTKKRHEFVLFNMGDRLLASVLKMHRSNKISLYLRGLC